MKLVISLLLIVLIFTCGLVIGTKITISKEKQRLIEYQMLADKHLELFYLMCFWVQLKQQNKSIAEFFEKRGCQTIAIYGLSHVGECFLRELQDANVVVKYAIDKNKINKKYNIEIKNVDEELEKVDVIVVTAITYFDEIYIALKNKTDAYIVSMVDIILETLYDT